MNFGRFYGWSLGEISRVDMGYLIWLAERPEGRPYKTELAAIVAARDAAMRPAAAPVRRGLFGRR